MAARDLTGERFGRLIVTGIAYRKPRKPKGYRTYWNCKCDCGNEAIVNGELLTEGRTKSCGCYRKEVTAACRITHHKADTRLYNVWLAIKRRCRLKTDTAYKWYGARGITICEEWLDFECFYNWAIANGYDESAPKGQYTIERIDVNGNYEPDNCKWITQKEQARNRRKTLKYTINGEEKALAEWCEIYGVPYHRTYERVRKHNWPVIKALTTRKGVRLYGNAS